jgi:hypothetical protein
LQLYWQMDPDRLDPGIKLCFVCLLWHLCFHFVINDCNGFLRFRVGKAQCLVPRPNGCFVHRDIERITA